MCVEGAGNALHSAVYQAVFPPRGTRMTARTSSAGPPAQAPPGRSASGATPRPHGRPSTTAAQVLSPMASLPRSKPYFLLLSLF